jgi:glycosyltransferase involved in cell wall biosynthesis
MDNIKKVVVTLTTVPERLSDTKYGDNGVIACIKSLQNQNYDNFEIHFNIPHVSSYSGDEYIIPEWLGEFDKVKIFRMDDLGPITKIKPTIERITNPETIIIVCDDDLVYHEDMIKKYEKDYDQLILNGNIDISENKKQIEDWLHDILLYIGDGGVLI